MPKRMSLYKAYDETDRLVYVGITLKPPVRLRQHQLLSEWWPSAYTIRLEHFATEDEARARELELIVSEKPSFNIAGNPDATPKRPPRPAPPAPLPPVDVKPDRPSIDKAIRRAAGDALWAILLAPVPEEEWNALTTGGTGRTEQVASGEAR